MKIRICLVFFIIIIINFPGFADELDCNQFKKLSAKYIECNANKLKNKTNEKVKISKEKFEKSGIKDKLKKFKESKTLTDLIKD
jgi:hypothetical protein|tara:strand:+ start:1044 stop:1295 length:252 start_codon:yes stop_codon:yes gene_type:complete